MGRKRGRPRKGRWRTRDQQRIHWQSEKHLHQAAAAEIRRRLQGRLLGGLFGDGDAGCSIVSAEELDNPTFRLNGRFEKLRCP